MEVTEVRYGDILLKWLIMHGSDWVDIRDVWSEYKLSMLEAMGFIERKENATSKSAAYLQFRLTDKGKQVINRGLQIGVSGERLL